MSYFNNVTEVAINMHQYVSVIFPSGWIVEDRHYLFAVKEAHHLNEEMKQRAP